MAELKATINQTPNGVEAVKTTLLKMRELARIGKTRLAVRLAALALTENLHQKARLEEIGALFVFVRDEIRYIRDIRGVETIHAPDVVLELRQGDCDDKATLLAALLESIGYKTRFAAVGFKPNHYSHVYVEVFNNGFWIPLDATMPYQGGWEAPSISSKMTLEN